MKYLALGDSYTIGEGVSPSERWPVYLTQFLNRRGMAVDPPEIIARTGWTTDELMDHIPRDGIASDYDIVSLCIGVNNQYRGRPAEEFRQQFTDLLKFASEHSKKGAKVFVVSIPDWGVTPFAADRDTKKISGEIGHFNEIKREQCSKAGVPFVEITDLSRQVAKHPEYLAPDGLHYSGEMHRIWAKKIADELWTID